MDHRLSSNPKLYKTNDSFLPSYSLLTQEQAMVGIECKTDTRMAAYCRGLLLALDKANKAFNLSGVSNYQPPLPFSFFLFFFADSFFLSFCFVFTFFSSHTDAGYPRACIPLLLPIHHGGAEGAPEASGIQDGKAQTFTRRSESKNVVRSHASRRLAGPTDGEV